MPQAAKKTKIERDRFTADGVRLFNATREHGTVYSDGFIAVKYIQEYEGREVHYQGDGTPVGYKMGEPLPKHADELLTENEQLQAKVKDLEAAQSRTNELLARLMAKLEEKDPKPATPAQSDLAVDPGIQTREAPARGGNKPK